MFNDVYAGWHEGANRYDRYDPRKVYAPRERRRTNLFLGVELELETKPRHSAVEIMNAAEGDPTWAWGSDGSLMNGVELKTMPITWKYFQNNFDFTIFDKLRECASPMYGSSATAGIHIHMSRDAFTTAQMARFVQFHYDNPEICKLMGGRLGGNPERWCSFSLSRDRQDSYTDGHRAACRNSTTYAAYIAGGGQNLNRYQCLNFHHSGTVELRYFQATTNVNRFKANVQWARALYVYCQKERRGGLTEKGITAFIGRNPQFADAYAVINGAASHAVIVREEVPAEITDAPSQPGYENGNEGVTVSSHEGQASLYMRAFTAEVREAAEAHAF